MAVYDGEIRDERSDALGKRITVRIAQLGWAEVRLRLVDVQAVGPAEQGEEVLGMVEEEGEAVRALLGEDRRHGAGRPLVGRRRIPIPGRILRQPGEVRVAGGVELTVRVEQRDGGSSSKTTATTGAPDGALARRGSGGVSRSLETGENARKRTSDEDRRDADDGEEHSRRARPRVQERTDAPDRRGDRNRLDSDAAECLQGEERHQRREEDEMKDCGDPPAARPPSASTASRKSGGGRRSRGRRRRCPTAWSRVLRRTRRSARAGRTEAARRREPRGRRGEQPPTGRIPEGQAAGTAR